MQPYQQQVMDEKTALDGNIKRLIAFWGGDIYRTLSVEDLVDLLVQVEQMKAYKTPWHGGLPASDGCRQGFGSGG